MSESTQAIIKPGLAYVARYFPTEITNDEETIPATGRDVTFSLADTPDGSSLVTITLDEQNDGSNAYEGAIDPSDVTAAVVGKQLVYGQYFVDGDPVDVVVLLVVTFSSAAMPLIDITGYPLLTDKIEGLSAEVLLAQRLLAESLLGITSARVGLADAGQIEMLRLAVALQVNLQIEQGTNAFVISQERAEVQGATRSYRALTVHPQAAQIANDLWIALDSAPPVDTSVVEAFANLRPIHSLRRNQCDWGCR